MSIDWIGQRMLLLWRSGLRQDCVFRNVERIQENWMTTVREFTNERMAKNILLQSWKRSGPHFSVLKEMHALLRTRSGVLCKHSLACTTPQIVIALSKVELPSRRRGILVVVGLHTHCHSWACLH